jgi:hypothetical protein
MLKCMGGYIVSGGLFCYCGDMGVWLYIHHIHICTVYMGLWIMCSTYLSEVCLSLQNKRLQQLDVELSLREYSTDSGFK